MLPEKALGKKSKSIFVFLIWFEQSSSSSTFPVDDDDESSINSVTKGFHILV